MRTVTFCIIVAALVLSGAGCVSGPSVKGQGVGPPRKITDEELITLSNQGLSFVRIARLKGMGKVSVWKRLARLKSRGALAVPSRMGEDWRS